MFKPIGEAFFLMQHNLSPQDMGELNCADAKFDHLHTQHSSIEQQHLKQYPINLTTCLCHITFFASYISVDLLKLQFATKILSMDSSYTMIFGGSSVTAGHDNAGGQAYPHVIKQVDTVPYH